MGWSTTPFETLVTFTIGGAWGAPLDNTDTGDAAVAVVRGTEFRNWMVARAKSAASRSIPKRVLETRQLGQGDLVIEVSGGGPTQPVGRVLLIDAAALDSSELPLVCSNFCRRVVLTAGVEPRFVFHQLQHKYSLGDTNRFQTATTNIRNLNFGKYLAGSSLKIPPVAEQRRIVAVIEEQFSRLDAGLAGLEGGRARLASLTKAILLAAVPEEPPQDWTLSTVADAGTVALGRQRSPKFHNGPNMKQYLRVANVFEDRIDTTDVMSMHFSDEEFARFRLKKGDILLNEGQSPHLIGRPAMYRGVPPDTAFTNSLLRFRVGAGVLPEWALLVFRRHLHAKRFLRESQITTNIAHLSAGRFKTIEFPIPPVDEQRRIVADVDRQLTFMTQTVNTLHALRDRAAILRLSILAAAFSGELVPQDPSDEPASVVLERITTEWASSNRRKPASRRIRTKGTG
jgi:type I restriction enzyme S subunit